MNKRISALAFATAIISANVYSVEDNANTSAKLAANNYSINHNSHEALNPDEMTACLLPGKVRNLGSRMVYIAPRKRVVITRVECDIRGGEVVDS